MRVSPHVLPEFLKTEDIDGLIAVKGSVRFFSSFKIVSKEIAYTLNTSMRADTV